MEFEFTADEDRTLAGAAGATADLRTSVLMAAAKLVQSIERQLAKQIDRLPAKDEVLAAAGRAYDQYIAPIDIPGIPSTVEPWVDQMLRVLFLRFVAGVYDQLQTL